MTATFPLPPAFRHATALPRADLERLIEELVTMLDAADGDPDMEEDNEDRCEGRDDDMTFRYQDRGAGDPDDGDPYMDEEDEHDREQCY